MNLLTSKYFLPAQEMNHLRRDEEVKAITANGHAGVTFVIAPAGFGKSSFVSEWVQQSDCANLWLSLDTSESDIFTFACYLLTGLKRSLKQEFDAAHHFCQPNIRQDDQQFLVALLNELETIEQPFSIVFDDFYLAQSQAVCDFVSNFIKSLPRQCRLIIISRNEPKLSISKLKLANSLTEIGCNELRLNYPQILEYLSQNSMTALEHKVIENIATVSQGWMILIKLMSLNSKLGQVSSVKLVEDNNVEQYVIEEVVNQLPQKTIDFLYQSAGLTSLNADLCDHSLQRSDSGAQLSFLSDKGLFLVPLDNKQGWYRYHHLFAEVLVKNSTLDKPSLKQIHTGAATWLWQQKMTQQALTEAEFAQDNALLLSMLEQLWLTSKKDVWLGSNDNYLNIQIKQAGTKFLLSYPYLYAIYSLNNISVESQVSITLLRQLRATLSKVETLTTIENSALTVCYLAEAYLGAAQQNLSQVHEFGDKALSQLKQKQDKTEQEHTWLGSACILMAGVNWSAGKMLKAQELMLDSINSMEKTSNASAIISSYFILIHTLYGSGKNQLAAQYIKAAMSLLDMFFAPLPQGAAEIYLAAAYAEFERGKIDIAETYLSKAETLSVQSGINEAKHFYPKLKANIKFEQGNSHLAATLLTEAEKLKTITPFSDAMDANYWQTRFDLINKNQLVMNNWWRKQAYSTCHPPSYREELNYLTWLHWGLIENNYDNSEFNQIAETLPAIIESARQDHRYRTVLEAECLGAFIELKHACNQAAIALLQDAVTISSNNGLRFYLSQLPIIKTIFNDQGLSRELPAKLANYFLPTNNTQTTRLVEPLSKTELKILQQLQTELSGPEICKLCFISLNTFRTHTKNIYSKLNVNSRMAAVNKGKQLELI